MKHLLLTLPALAMTATAAHAYPASGATVPLDQASVGYRQCLARSAAKISRLDVRVEHAASAARADCAEMRESILASANGNADVADALARLDDWAEATFAERTKTIRAMRIVYNR
jgi:hypothetical protein